MNEEQKTELRKPLAKYRVQQKPGGMSYLEGWDVISKLNHIFDFDGWSKFVRDVQLIQDDPVTWTRDGKEKSGFDVCYRCTVRLEIGGKVSEDVGTGMATHQPVRGEAHDLALKAAATDGLKRCAKDMGNQFGLSLYNNGSLNVSYGELGHAES